MELSLLTYNVLFNRAFSDLKEIISFSHPDILCLQEVDTNESNLHTVEQFGYRLADYSNSFIKFGRIFGVATFYNEKKIRFIDSSIAQLPRNIYEAFLHILRILHGGNNPRTVLKTEFILKKTREKLSVFNTHLVAYGTNEARMKQLKKILDFARLYKKEPVLIAGDFNYIPYRRRSLERLTQKYHLREATKSIAYTNRMTREGKFEQYNLFQKILIKFAYFLKKHQFKPDYIFYKNLRLMKVKRIKASFSDHFPILAQFKI